MSTLPLNAGHSPFLPMGFQASPERSPWDKKAAVLKHIAQSERLVCVRPASRLEVRPRPEMISTGIAELDVLTGGIPRGCLTEVCGPASSGKSSVLLATMAAATRREEASVLIDASDGFDPISGAAAGLDFNRLLWIRCSEYKAWGRTPLPPDFMRTRKSASPNPIFVEARASLRLRSGQASPVLKLEQVLKATDLILQSGGFGLVALDLAGIPEKFVRRIPLTSWFRFQRAVEYTKTVLLVVSEFPCAQTCAALALKLRNEPSAFRHQPSGKPSHAQVLREVQVQAEIMRSRLECKPVQSVKTAFTTQAAGAG